MIYGQADGVFIVWLTLKLKHPLWNSKKIINYLIKKANEKI